VSADRQLLDEPRQAVVRRGDEHIAPAWPASIDQGARDADQLMDRHLERQPTRFSGARQPLRSSRTSRHTYLRIRDSGH
jgi:hypothetical protein